MPEHVSLLQENGRTTAQTVREEGGKGRGQLMDEVAQQGSEVMRAHHSELIGHSAYSLSASSLQLGPERKAREEAGFIIYAPDVRPTQLVPSNPDGKGRQEAFPPLSSCSSEREMLAFLHPFIHHHHHHHHLHRPVGCPEKRGSSTDQTGVLIFLTWKLDYQR